MTDGNRLDIALVGIAGNERIPSEAEALTLHAETSTLYCSPDHPCADVTDAASLKAVLAASRISAHSLIFNPIDNDLDPMLLDQSDGAAQDTIVTAYLFTVRQSRWASAGSFCRPMGSDGRSGLIGGSQRPDCV